MVRNVVMIRFKPGTPEAQIDAVRDALEALDFPERTNLSIGRDAGLREGNMDFVALADFPDEDSYRRFDADEEHNRVRRELIAPIAESVERCQYQYRC
jgi:Stress responsive A/B Barrel Domain